MSVTAENLRRVADIANEYEEGNNILKEIKERALNGYYNYACYDVLANDENKLLKLLGFKVTTGQNAENHWFVVEW